MKSLVCNCLLTYDPEQFGGVQAEAGAEGVPQCSNHRVHQDGSQVVKEEASRHEISSITHDGRQQEEEEEGRVQLVQLLLIGYEDDAAQDQTQQNQHAAFRNHRGEALREVEHCGDREQPGWQPSHVHFHLFNH